MALDLWGTSGDPTKTLEQLMAQAGYTSRTIGGEDSRTQFGQMTEDGWRAYNPDPEGGTNLLSNAQDTLNQQYHTPDGQFVRIGDRQLPVGQEQLSGLMSQAIDHPEYGRVVPVSAYNEAVKASYTGGSQLYLDPALHAIAPNAYNPSMNAERLGDYGPQIGAALITGGGASGAFGAGTVAAEGAAGGVAGGTGGGVTGGGLSAGGSSGLGLQAPTAIESGLVNTGIGSGGAGSTSLAGGTSGLGLTGGGYGTTAGATAAGATAAGAASAAGSGGGSGGSGGGSGGSFTIPGTDFTIPNNVMAGGLQAILGYLGAGQQADAFRDVANQNLALGAPYRDTLTQSYQPGFDLASQPGYGDAFNRMADISARSYSASHGNPAGNPSAQAGILGDVWNQSYLPALSNFRGQLGQFGGLGLNTSGAAQLGGAQTAGGGLQAIGYGLGTAFGGNSTMDQYLREITERTRQQNQQYRTTY